MFSRYLNLILFSFICSSVFDEGSVSVLILDLKIFCIFSVIADIASWRRGNTKMLKVERLAVSREPQTARLMRLVQTLPTLQTLKTLETLIWSNLWANLEKEADISQAVDETWCHDQLLLSLAHNSSHELFTLSDSTSFALLENNRRLQTDCSTNDTMRK